MPRKTDKRIRLIEAAKVLIHQQGFNLTTLAHIAHEADVPLGNVYYYFKTKEAIGEAVIDKLAGELSEFFVRLNENPDPKARLNGYVQTETTELELTARYGCRIGGLCQELGKQGGTLADQAAKLLHDILEWCETQFRGMGLGEKSPGLALHYVSAIQGIYLLTHTFKDPKLTLKEANLLQDWLNSLNTERKTSHSVREEIAETA